MPKAALPIESEWADLWEKTHRGKRATDKIYRMLKREDLECEAREHLEDLHLKAQHCYVEILKIIAARRKTAAMERTTNV